MAITVWERDPIIMELLTAIILLNPNTSNLKHTRTTTTRTTTISTIEIPVGITDKTTESNSDTKVLSDIFVNTNCEPFLRVY
ncbi:unnamed protein product [Medioppia subpectinata]|uniref:Uncharacterized protein n=1 Tax=Medioppia subpectinata TaxID=1979941 RepID=A0A7R9L1C4_9ACAR|nr:unnamed protein product [Medioppia subpectinata]CAG2113442.1 unnamed protein product [Medioppia subpectinata]